MQVILSETSVCFGLQRYWSYKFLWKTDDSSYNSDRPSKYEKKKNSFHSRTISNIAGLLVYNLNKCTCLSKEYGQNLLLSSCNIIMLVIRTRNKFLYLIYFSSNFGDCIYILVIDLSLPHKVEMFYFLTYLISGLASFPLIFGVHLHGKLCSLTLSFLIFLWNSSTSLTKLHFIQASTFYQN